MFSGFGGIKLEINNTKIFRNSPNMKIKQHTSKSRNLKENGNVF